MLESFASRGEVGSVEMYGGHVYAMDSEDSLLVMKTNFPDHLAQRHLLGSDTGAADQNGDGVIDAADLVLAMAAARGEAGEGRSAGPPRSPRRRQGAKKREGTACWARRWNQASRGRRRDVSSIPTSEDWLEGGSGECVSRPIEAGGRRHHSNALRHAAAVRLG